MQSILIEKLEVLNGDRRNKAGAAVKRGDLQSMIASLPAQPRARAASAAPTQDEYNALVEDVQQLYAVFNAMRARLQ